MNIKVTKLTGESLEQLKEDLKSEYPFSRDIKDYYISEHLDYTIDTRGYGRDESDSVEDLLGKTKGILHKIDTSFVIINDSYVPEIVIVDTEFGNFISCDSLSAINSYEQRFKVGDLIGHEGSDDLATILSFKIEEESNEVLVETDKGSCHLDFCLHPNLVECESIK